MENNFKKINLCETCQHRFDSIARVVKWRERGSVGMVCDPAPRAECKDHDGYNRSGTKEFCTDYVFRNEDVQKFVSYENIF
jgi:hypothetical protein